MDKLSPKVDEMVRQASALVGGAAPGDGSLGEVRAVLPEKFKDVPDAVLSGALDSIPELRGKSAQEQAATIQADRDVRMRLVAALAEGVTRGG